MITKAEHKTLNDIKSRALSGKHVSSTEKQWVLDLAKKMQKSIPKTAFRMAQKQGFDVVGLVPA